MVEGGTAGRIENMQAFLLDGLKESLLVALDLVRTGGCWGGTAILLSTMGRVTLLSTLWWVGWATLGGIATLSALGRVAALWLMRCQLQSTTDYGVSRA